jgi:hypothetical protein
MMRENSIINQKEMITEYCKRYEDFGKINYEDVKSLMLEDLKAKHSINDELGKRRLIDKYINKIYIKRLNDNEYNFIFDLNFKYNKEVLPKLTFEKTYIKRQMLWH